MTILLHGQDSVASRQRLLELKNSFSGDVVEVTDPSQVVEQTLFADKRLFIFWHDKKLTASQIKNYEKDLPDLKIEEFKINPVVFKFLDALTPAGQKTFFPLWQQYLTTENVEVAAVMLMRQFRMLLNPDDPDIASWQKAKLQSQAKSFGREKIKAHFKKLLEIDYQVKSGQNAVSLTTSLELFLLTI